MDAVEIRDLSVPADLLEVEALQRKTWGARSQRVVPHHVLAVAAGHRGIVLGAYVRGKLVGCVLGFPGQRDGTLCHLSHALIVRPAYRRRGIGEALKRRQRERAVRQGAEIMTWTFDPLDAALARFNLHTLGACSRTYLIDLASSGNGEQPAAGRLLVHWDLRAPRPLLPASGRPLIVMSHTLPTFTPEPLESGDAVSVPLPGSPADPEIVGPGWMPAWRQAVKEALRAAFACGYVARDVIDGAYVLDRDGA